MQLMFTNAVSVGPVASELCVWQVGSRALWAFVQDDIVACLTVELRWLNAILYS
jgi:hypothetical protein